MLPGLTDDGTSQRGGNDEGNQTITGPAGSGADPGRDLSKAKSLYEAAKRAGDRNQHHDATRSALEAWKLVQRHKGDKDCQQLANELMEFLEVHGEAGNGNSPVSRKPVVIQ